jgi:cyclophilin family peptidyl-prolyl cis-trans isomerase
MRVFHGGMFCLAACLAGACLASVGCGGGGGASTPEGDASQATAQDAPRLVPTAAAARASEPYPQVLLHTSLGNITLKLDAQHAPGTVANFLDHVQSGHYNETIFHEVDAGYVVLGGGYRQDLSEKKARYTIRNEADNGLKNRRATIAMSRQLDTIDSATCQFFINVADNPSLDHRGPEPENFGYCVFGEVVEGMDVVDRIAQLRVHEADGFEKLPEQTVLIESAIRRR